jgi:hypothetical protein
MSEVCLKGMGGYCKKSAEADEWRQKIQGRFQLLQESAFLRDDVFHALDENQKEIIDNCQKQLDNQSAT